MKVELKKWSLDDKKQLMDICNSVEREYLSDRLPYPYTEECADWWLNMVLEHDGKDGVFRAIVADGKIVGNIDKEFLFVIQGERRAMEAVCHHIGSIAHQPEPLGRGNEGIPSTDRRLAHRKGAEYKLHPRLFLQHGCKAQHP